MTASIHVESPQAGPDDPRRLNLFPGLALPEQAFRKLQDYTDDRMAPLAGRLQPGILAGFEVSLEEAARAPRLRFRPGRGVTGAGQLVRLYTPLVMAWSDLLTLAERDRGNAPLKDGLYLLTLRSVVEEVDALDTRSPAIRTETDPTRERRLEVVTLPGLVELSRSPRLLSLPQQETVNRLSVGFLDASPFTLAVGAVPVGMVKVADRQLAWLESVGGRFMAEADAPHRTFLAHTLSVLQAGLQPLGSDASPAGFLLTERLGLSYLPAAGALPPALLRNPADHPPQLDFNPSDLGIDLIPVPANTVEGIIAEELSRGYVDLLHPRRDRLRLMLAIPDLDYRPDLLDLPLRDVRAEATLCERFDTAEAARQAWRNQWQKVFGNLAPVELLDTLLQGTQPRLPGDVADQEPVAAELARPERSATRARVEEVRPPVSPDAFRGARRSLLVDAFSAGKMADDPVFWLDDHPPRYEAVPAALPETDTTDGLLRQRADLRAQIKDMQTRLETSYKLLNELNDYLGLQRQHFDALTVSFSALAGGVAGDGSGLKVMRWTNAASYTPASTK